MEKEVENLLLLSNRNSKTAVINLDDSRQVSSIEGKHIF